MPSPLCGLSSAQRGREVALVELDELFRCRVVSVDGLLGLSGRETVPLKWNFRHDLLHLATQDLQIIPPRWRLT
jgi:hypothetical protein